MRTENLPISKMLTVSTAHITEETFEKLLMGGTRNEIMLPVYSKAAPGNGENYGLIIYLTPGCMNWDKIPDDLVPVLKLSLASNCDVLCLDGDGPELEDLAIYTWEN